MSGKRMLRFALVCALVLAWMLAGSGCFSLALFPRHVTLSNDYTTLSAAPDAQQVYRIEIANMTFTNSENVAINIVYSDTPSVEAVISRDLMDYGFAITVRNGILRVAPARALNIQTERFELTIHALFNEVDLSGGYEVAIDANDAPGALALNVSGAASGSVSNLYGSDFEARISGAGMFTLYGAVDRASLHISGAGSIEGAGLICNALEAKISGAGDMVISVVDELEAKVSGIGSIEYYGAPVVTQSISGLGSVSQKSEHFPGA